MIEAELAGSAESRVRRLLRPDADTSLIQMTATAVLIVASAIWARPLGTSGAPLAILILVVANCLLMAMRHVPERIIPENPRTGVLYLSAATSAALLALAHTGPGVAFAYFTAGHAGYRLPPSRSRWVAVACSVLAGGVLLLQLGPGHKFTPWYVGAASGFAVLLGMLNRSRVESYQAALAAADSAERAARAEASEIVLAERGRIARDVHDVLAHSLAGINMQLDLANALLDTGKVDQAREVTGRAQSLVRESLVEAQRTVRALREDALPLVETLRAMLRNGGQGEDVEVEGEVRDVPTKVSQALIRAGQEALTNAHKYAPGMPVRIALRYRTDGVDLDVVNPPADGERPLAEAGSGLGLVGMRERLALVGGTVLAGPETDGGWRVSVAVPA